MAGIVHLSVVLGVNLVILILARHKRIFDNGGLLAAFSVGFAIGWLGDISWLLLLLLFMFTGFLATKYKFTVKERMGVQEGRSGERGWENVLATGLVPALVAVLSYPIPPLMSRPFLGEEVAALVFISAISVAAADTLASELGVLSKRAYLITTGERVEPGTDGGVSANGQMWALVASAYAAVAGYVFLLIFSGAPPYEWYLWFVPLAAGFIGCQVDSLLGATIEGRYFIGKHSVNLLSIAAGTALAWVMIP